MESVHTTDLGRELRRDLIHRHVASGLARIAEARAEIFSDCVPDGSAIELIAELANWIDFDLSLRDAVGNAVKRWPEASRGDLLHRHALLLGFADAAVSMHNEKFETAGLGFQEMIKAAEVLHDPHLVVIATFYLSRCKHYQANGEADQFALKAHEQASQLEEGALPCAVVDILRSRILLKTKPFREAGPLAGKLLESAQNAFKGTDDHIAKGNILTFQAQIASRGLHQGKNALDLLDEAISEFGQHPVKSGQPAEARARVHRARQFQAQIYALKAEGARESGPVRVERKEKIFLSMTELGPRLLKALGTSQVSVELKQVLAQMQDDLDKAAVREKPLTPAASNIRGRLDALRASALGDLKAAGDIYKALGHERGIGNCFTFIGYNHLDAGDYVSAMEAGETAYEVGRDKSDTVQARAAILCAAVAYAMFEEGIDDGVNYARSARDWAERAMKHAPKAEPRIVGRAHVWQSLTRLLTIPGAQDRREAEFHCDQAKDLLKRFPGGSLQRNFDILQRRLNSGGEAAAVLRNWADAPNGKSFAQLENAITLRASDVARTIPELCKLLDCTRNKAEGLLKRAGVFKMPKPSNESAPMAMRKKTGHHAEGSIDAESHFKKMRCS